MALYLADRRDKARWVLDFTNGHGRYITVVNTAGFVLTPNWAVGGDLAGVAKKYLNHTPLGLGPPPLQLAVRGGVYR